MIFFKILSVLVGSYLIGSIPFGFLIGKSKGVDIRKVGSCNIGATNVSRCVGKGYGKICFFLDLMKGYMPTIIAMQIFTDGSNLSQLMIILAGASSIVGHMFSVYLKFTGGKGVATGAGIVLALSPITFAVTLASWAIIFLATRYVSLASIIASFLLILFGLLLDKNITNGTLIFFAIIAVVTTIKHRANIKRLLNGTESKFSKKDKK